MSNYGREVIQIVEIDQPMCTLHYGEFPCTAELGVTGNRRCYRTPATCQDIANIELQPRTLRFARKQYDLLQYGPIIPSVISVTTTPGEINVAGMDDNVSPIGRREVVTVNLEDHKYSDNIVDKYRLDRADGTASLEDFGGLQRSDVDSVYLRDGASIDDDAYVGMQLVLITPVPFPLRTIVRYIGATRQAILDEPWPSECLYLPGVAGNYASTPDSVANSLSTDFDIRARIAPVDWSPPNQQIIAGKYGLSGQFGYALSFENGSSGKLQCQYSTDGTTQDIATSTVATGFVDGSIHWVRATRTKAAGQVKFFTSENGVTWTQLGSTVTGLSTSNLFDSNSFLGIGDWELDDTKMFFGRIYYVDVRSVIDGTISVKFDPANDAGFGDTSFTSSTGEVWTINQT